MCVSIPIQGWHLSTETWPFEVGSLQDGTRAHVDCRTWPLETGKPIGKIFLYNLLFKRIFYLSSLLSLFKYSLLVRLYPFPLLTTKIRLMRPLQEVQNIGQPRPFGMKRILPYTRRIEATTVEASEELKNLKTLTNSMIYMTFRRPNPCCILMLDAMICELSYSMCVFW